MDFSQWLLIIEFRNEIYKNLYPSKPQTSEEIINKILEEIFNSNIEIIYENEEQEDDTPAELSDPFSGSDDAQPAWNGDDEEDDEDDEHEEISDISKKYAKLKDAMLMLRYKAMRLRKAKIYKLKNLSLNDQYSHEDIAELLIKLGYFSGKTIKSNINKKIKKAYENAITEKENEYPKDRETLLRGTDLLAFERNVYSALGELIKGSGEGSRIMYSGGSMAYGEDTMTAMEKIIRMLKTRQVKSLKAQDWSFSKLMPLEFRPAQKKGEQEEEQSERVILGSLKAAQENEKFERFRSREKAEGADKDNDTPTRKDIENIPSATPPANSLPSKSSFWSSNILNKMHSAIMSLPTKQKIIFCLAMGIKCDSVLSPTRADLANMDPLEVKGQGSISARIANILKEKDGQGQYVIPDEVLAGIDGDTEFFRNSNDGIINKAKYDAQKKVFSIFCADKELRNSELIKWIMSVNGENCPGSSVATVGKTCPVCGMTTYSSSGVHPQCMKKYFKTKQPGNTD